MKLAALQIDCFGARSNLRLDSLSDRLNVVYGPNGSGKSTIVNFVRWMLFGGAEESSRAYWWGLHGTASGRLSWIDERHQRRSLQRSWDAARGEQVHWGIDDHNSLSPTDARPLTVVEPNEFNHVFSFGLEQSPAIERLCEIAAARDISLEFDASQLREVRRLTQHLEELRRTCYAWPSDEPPTTLQQRRQRLLSEIGSLEQRYQGRLRLLQHECDDVSQQIAADRRQLESVQGMLRRTDATLESRRSELDQLAHQAQATRERWLDDRRRELGETEQQIDQWHHVLDSIRQRQEHLETLHAHSVPQSALTTSTDEHELRLFLRTLSQQIDDLPREFVDGAATEDGYEDLPHGPEWRHLLGATWTSMRDDMQRLCREVLRQQANARHFDRARELDFLRRCQMELGCLVDVLAQRRQPLMSTPEYCGSSGLEPSFDARLNHLYYRRDQLVARSNELQTRVDQHHHRLAHLQASQPHVDEARQLERLRRELEDLDHRLRQAEQSDRQRAEIDALQRQIDQSQQRLGPSEILHEASVLLDRMTEGFYRKLSVRDRNRVVIEDRRGHVLEYHELSRGTRDQAYLSLALALTLAYRQRGIELPVLLNDIFANMDAERAPMTAKVLAEFAERGQQILLFTRDERLAQTFAPLAAKVYTLRERTAVDESPRWIEPPRPVERPAERPAGMPHWREREYDWVARWEPVGHSTPPSAGPNLTDEVLATVLREDSPLDDVAWLDRLLVGRLGELGVTTVQQFLSWDSELGQHSLAGLNVAPANIRRWQSELALQCHVGLVPADAALLAVCGISGPQTLAESDADSLHRRIEELLAQPEARQRFGSIVRFERPRLSRWIQAAHNHCSRQAATIATRLYVHPQPNLYRTEAQPRLVPRARRVEPLAETLRFYLEPSDPILDAPSIGPKTAERFHAIGVTTVAELLALDPDDAAVRINYRRITAELIRTWQQQTMLVCRVPNLRGHDAQLLIACQVFGPEQLTKLEPQALLAQVEQLLSTAEGKRILRGTQPPELSQLAAWIRWAQHARPMVAA